MKIIITYFLCVLCVLCGLVFVAAASGAIFLNSFNSGKLGEDMKVRHDLDRTSMGSETLDNILIRPQGMAYKRPGTEYIASVYGTYTAPVPEVPATYNFTYISENANLWGVPVGDGVMAGLDVDVAVDVGGGIVGLPFTGHPFTIGETILITGTTNYNGGFTVEAGTTDSQLQITDTYVSETFDGTELAAKKIAGLTSGTANMVSDSDGNLYYGHVWLAAEDTYITKIKTDNTLVYDFLNTGAIWPIAGGTGQTTGLAITPDDKYLYIWLDIDAPTDWGFMEKYDLATGDREWRSTGVTWPGSDIDIDADNNVYAADFASVIKYASADGSQTPFTDIPPGYEMRVDDDLGIVISAGYGFDPLVNFYVRKLDNSGGDSMNIGGNYFIARNGVLTHDGYIYVIAQTPDPTLYKISWDGTSLAIVDSVAGPAYGVGIYFDLYDNLVVINQNYFTAQTSILYFYDTDLAYIGKIDGMESTMLATWSLGYYGRGDIVFDGDLGTPGVTGGWSYAGFDPNDRDNIRLIPFEYSTDDAYVLDFGHEYIGFLRTVQ